MIRVNTVIGFWSSRSTAWVSSVFNCESVIFENYSLFLHRLLKLPFFYIPPDGFHRWETLEWPEPGVGEITLSIVEINTENKCFSVRGRAQTILYLIGHARIGRLSTRDHHWFWNKSQRLSQCHLCGLARLAAI